MNLKHFLVLAVLLGCGSAVADDDKVKSAIGGGAGGAIGAVIGDEIGDRNGAIVGAAVGAAVGVAIATDGSDEHSEKTVSHEHDDAAELARIGHPGYHCPPGQAKKNRC